MSPAKWKNCFMHFSLRFSFQIVQVSQKSSLRTEKKKKKKKHTPHTYTKVFHLKLCA